MKTKKTLKCKINKITSGFTLIELLVVMAIIGILTSLLVANFAQIRSRARDAERKSDLSQIQKALQLYYDDHKAYPTPDPGALGGFVFGNAFTSASTSAPYMASTPQDALSTSQIYVYTSLSPYDSYRLEATLENPSDKDISQSQSRCGFPTPTPGIYMVCPD